MTIKVAIIGVGNCCSSLVQGLEYYSEKGTTDSIGLMHYDLGGYTPRDIKVCLAFDVDVRKVGQDLSVAILAKPNCTKKIADVPKLGVVVKMGKILDGVSEHMELYSSDYTFVVSEEKEPNKEDVIKALVDSEADILINYLPVGSQSATEFYAECALEAGVGFINNIPVFIASDPVWEAKFVEAGLPIVGDDIKSQVGATIVHRVLTDLFKKRGVPLERTYQLNTGGNTDFLNMLNKRRLKSKKISKTEAVQAAAKDRLDDFNIHVGPSDHVPWQQDNKVAFIRMEGKLFGGVPMNLELRLSVEDSPNSAGVAIDSIRCCKLALDHEVSGALASVSSCFCKHPPTQVDDDQSHKDLEVFIKKYKRV